MLKTRSLPLFLSLLALPLAMSVEAWANFTVCNDTDNLTGVAIGYKTEGNWITEGWWRIPPGVCAPLIEGDLASRYFYLFAEDAETGGQWRGPVFMCTSNKEFRIDGLKNCFTRGYERTGFFEVDTGSQKNWQVRLDEASQSETEPGQEESAPAQGADTQ